MIPPKKEMWMAKSHQKVNVTWVGNGVGVAKVASEGGEEVILLNEARGKWHSTPRKVSALVAHQAATYWRLYN